MSPTERTNPVGLTKEEALKTYRYLRLGMVGAVVLLAASIAIERSKVDCFQTSISAYYYTPVRLIFVGSMMMVGVLLIVYKGRDWRDDNCLSFAGMLAPLVAVVPTTDVGVCWSIEPRTPIKNDDGSLTAWVINNIDNNVDALLITGAVGLVAAIAIAVGMWATTRSTSRPPFTVNSGTVISLVIAALALAATWWLKVYWEDFYTRVHGFAAVLMFVLLILAVIMQVWFHREQKNFWFWSYATIAFSMMFGGVLIPSTRLFGEHTVFALETVEIVLFASFWILQTIEKWPEEVVSGGGSEEPATAEAPDLRDVSAFRGPVHSMAGLGELGPSAGVAATATWSRPRAFAL